MAANKEDLISELVDVAATGKQLKTLLGQIEEVQVAIKRVNSSKISLEGSKGFTEVTKGARGLKTEVDELELAQRKLKKALAEQNVELQGFRVQTEAANKAAKAQAKEQLGLTNEYERQTKRLAEVKRELKALSVQGKETTDEFKELNEEFKTLDSTIRKAEEGVGEFSRNVGNYTEGFKGALTTLEDELASISNKLNSGDFKGDEFDELTKKQNVLKEATALVNQEFTSATAQSNAYKEAATRIGLTFGTNSDVFKNFSAEVGKGNKSIKDISGALNAASGKGKAFGGVLQTIFSGLRNIANIIPGLGISGIVLLLFTPLAAAGQALIDYTKKAFTAKDANDKLGQSAEDLKKKQELLNKSLDDANSEYADAVKLVDELSINVELAKKGFLDKDKVLNQYNTTIGKTTGEVKTLDEAEKELTENGPAYIRMMLLKAAANLALGEAAKKAFEAEQKRRKEAEEFLNVGDKIVKFGAGNTSAPGFVPGLNDQNIGIGNAFSKERSEKRKKEAIEESEKEQKTLEDIAKKFQEDAAKLALQFGFDFFGGDQDAKKKKDDSKKKEEDRARELFEALIALQEAYDNGQIEALKRVADEEKNINGLRITALLLYLDKKKQAINKDAENEIALNNLTGAAARAVRQNALNEIAQLESDVQKQIAGIREKAEKDANDKILAAREAFQEKINQLGDDSYERLKRNHAKELEAIKLRNQTELDLQKDLRNKIEELAQQGFDFAITLVNRSAEIEINALQDRIDAIDRKKEKDIEVANQTIINEQDKAAKLIQIETTANAQKTVLENQQRQLKVKEAQFERASSLLKVGIDTFEKVALIKSQAALLLANPITAPYAAVALSQIPLVIASGAIAAAGIIATPIPRYKTGKGRGDNYEGLAVVGDGGRQEPIVRADGSMELSPAKDTLTWVGKDDIVFPSVEAFEKNMLQKSLKVNLGSKPQQKDSTAELMGLLIRENKSLRELIKNKPVANFITSPYGVMQQHKSITDQTDYFNNQTNWSV